MFFVDLFSYLRRLAPYFLLLIAMMAMPDSAIAQKRGRALADSIVARLPAMTADSNRVNLLVRLGSVYCALNLDTGLYYCRQAKTLAEQLQWDNGEANAYNGIGTCYIYQSKYVLALESWTRALAIFQRLNNRTGVLKTTGNIGIVYASQGDYSHALTNYFQALKYAEELGDNNSIAINLGNIGAAHEYLKNYEKALKYDFKALEMFRRLGNAASEATFLGNIGNAYIDMKQYDAALQYELQAQARNEQLGNMEGIIRDMLNIGLIYQAQQRHEQALTYYLKALERSKESGIRMLEGRALGAIGELLVLVSKDTTLQKERFSPAFARQHSIPIAKKQLLHMAADHLRQSIAIDLEINNLNELQHNYAILSDAQRLMGDPEGALESNLKYMAIKDSVFSMESKVTVANLETRRELELKDKQILIDKLEVAKKRNERVLFLIGIILLLTVVVIVIRNIRLEAARELSENKLNAFQARMNPHFIFNSLSSIQYLVLNNENERSADYLSEFSILMRQILDTSASSKVPLKTEIEMLQSYIELENLRFDCFKWNIAVVGNKAADHIEVPGMIIIQPFVENAILHGLIPKGEGGLLHITFERTDKHILCIVDDNGIGRERSYELNRKRNKEHQSHGIDIATNRLLLLNNKKKGLLNTVTYIDKQEGGIATGTTVIIKLPIL